MHSDSRQRCTMFKVVVGVLSLFVSGVASQTLDFSNLRSCEQSHIQWRNPEAFDPNIPPTSYIFSLEGSSNGISYALNITNVGPEGFDFTPNWAPGTLVFIHQSPPPIEDPFPNAGPVTIQGHFGNNNCTINAISVSPSRTDTDQPPPPPTPTFVAQGVSQTQCATSSVAWTSSVPPYDIQVSDANTTDGISASIELRNIQFNRMTLKLPFSVGTYAWVITDSIGGTSNASFPIVTSDDSSCLVMPPVSNSNGSGTPTTDSISTSTLDTPNATPSATVVSAPINNSTSKKSIIIAAVLGPVLGLLAVFGIGFFVYYRIRRRNREKELKMKQEVTYVPPQHARLIDVKVKPPDIE